MEFTPSVGVGPKIEAHLSGGLELGDPSGWGISASCSASVGLLGAGGSVGVSEGSKLSGGFDYDPGAGGGCAVYISYTFTLQF